MDAQGEGSAKEKRVPFTGLSAAQWQRLFDVAALAGLVLFLLYIGVEVYFGHGIDFRGYYAAARIVLDGGDPYDYHVVSKVLLEVTGEMGNNPYYYPPWFCIAFVPFVLLPFGAAKALWIALSLAVYWLGAWVVLQVLEWDLRGWRRWLVMLGGAYLLFWLSLRAAQVGALLFLLSALSLWGYQRDKPWLAGTTLILLLTKPNVTWLTVPFFGLFYLWRQRRAAWWALGVLGALLLISTLIVPGWYTHLADPDFGAGATQELDGPDRVLYGRLNAVLKDWLRPWRVDGIGYWVIWSVLALGSAVVLWLSWHNVRDEMYLMALVSAVGLLLTFYAMQYDYPPLLLAYFWVFRALSRVRGWPRWVSYAILGFAFTVPMWERPVYEGYWILLAILAMLLLLNRDLWHWPRFKEAHVIQG